MHVWRANCQVWYVACHVLYIYALIYIFMQWFIYIYAMFYIFMPCFIYIHVMFYIFMPCFIYLCQFKYTLHHYSFMLHQDFQFCCIVFSHLCCFNTTNLCCIKICPQFHFFDHPIQWEVVITCSSLWPYLAYRIWNYKV